MKEKFEFIYNTIKSNMEKLDKKQISVDQAKAIGIKLQAYQAYKGHRATPSISTLKKIVDFYEVKDLYTFLFDII